MPAHQPLDEAQRIAGDRRSDRRYDIHLELRWKLIRRNKVLETGSGCTIDLSSGGIRFDAGRELPVGLNVELSIAWPVLLLNAASMQLVVRGRIMRANGTRVAIRMMEHEFRTQGVARPQAAAQPGRMFPIPNLASSFSPFETVQ